MKKTDKMLFRMIKNSKGQFAAVVAIISAGVAVFIALSMSAANMDNTVKAYYGSCNFADLYIIAENIPLQKVKELEAISGIELVAGRIVLEAPVVTENPKERVNVKLISTKGHGDEINKCFLLEGKWPGQAEKEALALGQFAEARDISPGSKIKVQASGASYTIDISGVTANPEFVYLMESEQALMTNPEKFGILYIPEALARQMSGKNGVNEVLIKYAEAADEDAIIKSLEKQLKNYSLKQIIKKEDQMSCAVVQDEVDQINRISASVPFVFIFSAALVLIMMLGRMVKRDRIKIGILKAIGYKDLDIISHYTKYAAAAGIAGGGLGATAGMASAGGMTRVFLEYFNIPMLRTEFNYSSVLAIVAASCMFCIAAGAFGARGVVKISPADSMKSESPKTGKRTFLEYAPVLWRKLSFSQKLVIKNIFRNKKRAGFVLMGISLTYAMMLFTTSMPGTIDDMMNEHYLEFQKMDYIANFRSPAHRSAVSDIRHVIDVNHMEGKLEYPFEFENGISKQVVSVIGLQGNTDFYTFKGVDGDILTLSKTGIFIPETLACNLNLNVGDTVKLNTFIPGKNSSYIEVKGIVKQTLGLNAFMDINYMGEKLMEKNAVNGVYFNSGDDKIYEKLSGVPQIASVMSIEETRESFVEYMSVMSATIAFLIVFSGVLGFCIVYNATSIIIGEREMEFSALRVLGLSGNEIFKMILSENNLLMAAGIAFGIPLGMSLLSSMSAAVSTDMYRFDMAASPGAIAYAALFTALFVYFAQLATYQKIRKLDLLSALKNRSN